ncbi:unnamed protein product [Rhizophagus irregularis]|nr:unnamed protein product [Rhizophagus irregularis]CAB5386947.1 unnamed protein product [Rhizophagus irregularis]
MSQTNETFEEFFSRLNGVNGNSISSASEFMGNVNEAVGPFIPFIAIIATLTREIVKAYDIIKVLVEYCERIKEIFQEIIREFDSCSADLNLAVTTNTNEQMTKDLEILHSDMIEMKKFLDNVGGGITSIDDKTKEIIANTNEIKIQNQEIILHNKKIIKILHFTPLNEEINIFLLNEKLNTADDDQDSKIDASQHKFIYLFLEPKELPKLQIYSMIYI